MGSTFGSSGRSSSNSSQAAARLAEFQDVLTPNLMEDISDRLIEIRLEVRRSTIHSVSHRCTILIAMVYAYMYNHL